MRFAVVEDLYFVPVHIRFSTTEKERCLTLQLFSMYFLKPYSVNKRFWGSHILPLTRLTNCERLFVLLFPLVKIQMQSSIGGFKNHVNSTGW